MNTPKITKIYDADFQCNLIVLFSDFQQLEGVYMEPHEKETLEVLCKNRDSNTVRFILDGFHRYFVFVSKASSEPEGLEHLRQEGGAFKNVEIPTEEITIIDLTTCRGSLAYAEGLVLGRYRFHQYKSMRKKSLLEHIFIENENITEDEITDLRSVLESVYLCRNLVNDPQNKLPVSEFVSVMKMLTEEKSLQMEVFNKRKIQSLKMGGLLAVNQGSFTDPAFVIITHKPENHINKKPVIFVGKGVIFDTGGLNIKTGNLMSDMHSDKSGAAAAFSAIFGIYMLDLPVYTIALLPLTDNRPGNNAFAPGDIITMHNGKTVEIVNTDAEGRLILADALSYAKKFDPELVIDLATLTGSAARALGQYASVAFRNKQCAHFELLHASGENVNERLVEFPLWEVYGASIESEYADIKNLGGTEAGAISAAKFLEHFVDYPWIHLDIAGTAFFGSASGYHTKGATGVGTRLLIDFILNYYKLNTSNDGL